MTGPSATGQPARRPYRSRVRRQALAAAHAMLLERGWDRVRFGDVAVAAGVSRPTLYAEFGNKDGLGEALVLQETDRFLAGVTEELGRHPGDPRAAVTAAVAFTLAEAARSPLLHAVLTATRGGSDSLLPLLTTRSGPVLEAATAVLLAWVGAQLPEVPQPTAAEGVDALVRLVVSHLVLPADEPAGTPERLARLAVGHLSLSPRN